MEISCCSRGSGRDGCCDGDCNGHGHGNGNLSGRGLWSWLRKWQRQWQRQWQRDDSDGKSAGAGNGTAVMSTGKPGEAGYVIIDLNVEASAEVKQKLQLNKSCLKAPPALSEDGASLFRCSLDLAATRRRLISNQSVGVPSSVF